MPGFNVGSKGGTGGDFSISNTMETLRAHRWTITLFPNSKNPNTKLLAKDLVLPQMRIERQEILGGLIWYKFAKAVKWEDVEIVFYDTGGIIGDLENWRKAVWKSGSENNSGESGGSGGIQTHGGSGSGVYKQDCKFTLYSGAINNVVLLKNAWPVNIGHSRLSYTNSEIKQINLTLAYDWAEYTASNSGISSPISYTNYGSSPSNPNVNNVTSFSDSVNQSFQPNVSTGLVALNNVDDE